MSFIKSWDESLSSRYELVLVSPRNYFVYTPLLPAMCAGTVEERSIVEPVRAVLKSKGKFFEAKCNEILPEEKALVACFPEDAGFPEACFKLPYDILILSVGCVNNTFGIEGVEEHTTFFKTVEDAARLRLRVSECFERAALPTTTKEERENGFYDVLFVGEWDDGKRLHYAVKGKYDPGYGSTSRMLAETGMGLLESDAEGGVGTPGSFLGEALVTRLQERAELTFAVEQ